MEVPMYGILPIMPTNVRNKPVSAGPAQDALDAIGWKILVELQRDGRIQYAELGRRVGLGKSAVIERVRRMEEAEIITGYRADVQPAKVGRPVLAFILVNVVGDYLRRIEKLSEEVPEILECYRITGRDSFIMKVAVPSVEDLKPLIDHMTPFVTTTTSVVLSSVVTSRVIDPPPNAKHGRKQK
jgi:Lrp/AsnC family leucine-responsive transcriptional regulator